MTSLASPDPILDVPLRRCLYAALLAIPLVLLPDGFQFAHYPKILLLQLSLVVLAALCLRRGATQVSLGILILCVWTLLQTFRSLNPWSGSLLLATQTGALGVGLIVASCSSTEDDDGLLWAMALGGGLVSTVGVLEHLGYDWLPSAGRPSATMGFRNVAATVAGGSIPAAFWLSTKRGVGRLAGGAVLVAAGLFVVYARSRGAFVGLAAAALYGGVVGLRSGFPAASRLIPSIVATVLVASLSGIPSRYEDTSAYRIDEKKSSVERTVQSYVAEGGDRNRLKIWSATWSMILDHPVLGVGAANWSALFPAYDRGEVMHIHSAPRRPHNDVLWIWAELGLIGLGVYLWVLFRAFDGRGREGPWLAFQCVVLMIFVHGLFSFPREQAAPSLMFWVAIGALHRGRGSAWSYGATRTLWIGLVLLGLVGVWISVRSLRFDHHYSRALAAQTAEDRAQQIAQSQAALAWGTFDHRALLVLGDGLFDEGDHKGAAGLYRDYVAIEPYLPAALNNLGRSLIYLNEYAVAEPLLIRGAEILPEDGYLRNNLAETLRRQDRREEALGLFEGVEHLSANDHHSLGVLYAEMNQLTQAKQHYTSAIDLDSRLQEVIYSLAGIDVLEGRLEDSAKGYERFLAMWQGHPTYVRRARNRLKQVYPELAGLQVREGRVSDAEETYARLVALGEADASTLHAYASVLARLGRMSEAIEVGRRVMETDGAYVPIHLTMGQLYEAAGNRTAALGHYEAFLDRWEEPGGQRTLAQTRYRALGGR